MTRPPMTDAEMMQLANDVRRLLQQQTCCPLHAGEIILHVIAGFVLDDTKDDREKAAAMLTRIANIVALDLRAGRYVVIRQGDRHVVA